MLSTTRGVSLATLLAATLPIIARAEPPAQPAIWGEPLAHVVTEQLVAVGLYTAPRIDPSGRQVLLSSLDHSTLFLQEVGKGSPRAIISAPGAGHAPRWTPDGGGVAIRDRRAPFSGNPLKLYDLSGVFLGPDLPADHGRGAVQHRGRIKLFDGRGERLISPHSDERFFAPVLSPDGAHLVFSGLSSGLHLVNSSSGQRHALGPGDHAVFSADGRWLVFDRSQDDGHRIVASDLCLCKLDDSRPRCAPLTRSSQRAEMYPSLSRDARKLAFIAGDGIYVAVLGFADHAKR